MKTSFGMGKVLVLGLVMVLPQSLWAGKATLSGYGEVETKPEFVTLTVNVKSDCYTSASAASAANDGVARKVLDLLNRYANTAAKDEVIASGGFVERYTGYNPRTSQPVCINKFKKQNQLTLKTHAVAEFSQTFAELQDAIYSMGMDTPADSVETPTNYLEITAPHSGMESASMRLLERKALAIALEDARAKFEATLTLAGIKSYVIASYSENGNIAPPMPFPADSAGRSHAPSVPAPVQFGQLLVKKSIQVEFDYNGGVLNIP